jgi:hypothetical protein
MKKIVFLLSFIGFITFCEAQVGINTSTPSSNAVLDLNSHIGGTSYGGFLPPRITVAQRDLMPVTAADDGLIVYVTLADGSRCLQLYDGLNSTWEIIKCTPVPIPTPVTAFLETVGTPGAITVISAYEAANGFDNDSATFSSSSSPEADVRTSTPSNTIGASASGNIYFGTATNGTRNVLIQDINVTAYASPLTLQLLIQKGTNGSNGSELTIEYSTDGTTWTNVSVTNLPTGGGTSIWYERVLSTTIPNTIQQIRFSKTSATADFRIDDIEIIEP